MSAFTIAYYLLNLDQNIADYKYVINDNFKSKSKSKI